MSEAEEAREAAMHFEATKVSMKQDKNGVMLTIAIHPDQVPVDLMRAFVGSRYVIAAVRLGDDDKPVRGPDQVEGDRAVQSAAMLCRDKQFQVWLSKTGRAHSVSEEAAVQGIYKWCRISSRAELRTDHNARRAFNQLREEFIRGR